MANVLPDDVWTVLAPMLCLATTASVATTCREWSRVLALPQVDAAMAHAYARNALGDAAFWDMARCRPVETRKSLPTYRLEIKRIEEFKRAGGRGRVAACELYALWPLLDSVAQNVCR